MNEVFVLKAGVYIMHKVTILKYRKLFNCKVQN